MFRLWLWHSTAADTLCVSRHCVFVLCVSVFFRTHTILFYFSPPDFFLALYSLSLWLSLFISSLPFSILAYSDTPPFLLSLFHLFLFSSLTCSTLSSFLPFPLCLFVSVSLSRFPCSSFPCVYL